MVSTVGGGGVLREKKKNPRNKTKKHTKKTHPLVAVAGDDISPYQLAHRLALNEADLSRDPHATLVDCTMLTFVFGQAWFAFYMTCSLLPE